MARGEAKRKREARALRALAEKQKIDPSLLLDRANKSKKQKKSNEDGMPASLRRMLHMKALAEGKKKPTSLSTLPPRQQGDAIKADGPEDTTKTTTLEAEKNEEEKSARHKQRNNRELPPPPPPPTASSSLKTRKKEFLKKKKKLKKKGKSLPGNLDSGDEDEEPEARLQKVAAATKPSFGETADQPLKVNLKRKHWTNEEKKSSERCKAIFERQMKNATTAAAAQSDDRGGGVIGGKKIRKSKPQQDTEFLVEAYRAKKKTGDGGGGGGATLKSLAALVHKEKEPVGSM